MVNLFFEKKCKNAKDIGSIIIIKNYAYVNDWKSNYIGKFEISN
jgi:hypothetical protein